MTATYRNEQHAAIRAVSVDAISTCKPSGWQQQHSSGFVEELTKRKEEVEHLTPFDRLTQDCMTRALVHRTVTRGSFYALVAKYGADEQERAHAVNELVKLVSVDATDDFKRMMIWTWASVAVKRGVVGRIIDMGSRRGRHCSASAGPSSTSCRRLRMLHSGILRWCWGEGLTENTA